MIIGRAPGAEETGTADDGGDTVENETPVTPAH